MANKTLFTSATSTLPRADVRNEAGGLAYQLAPKHALAQLAATGCFNGTYYANAAAQLSELRSLVDQVDDIAFLAKLAVYSRERAFMKDMPAALLVLLARRDSRLFQRAFDRVVDNGRVLRTLFQMVRSGQFGRKSVSSSLQRAFQRWLNTASVERLLSASIGNDPSLRDILRLARPTPADNRRRALFGWLTGNETAKWAPATEADLPEQVRALVAYRQAETADQQVEILRDRQFRWDLLADAAKSRDVWRAIARQMGPQALRMNLKTLLRHEVFATGAAEASLGRRIAEAVGLASRTDDEMVDYVAGRIADAAAILRRNPDSIIVPFDNLTHEPRVDPQDSILSLAERLAKYGGGGTNCALPLAAANRDHLHRRFAGCVLVSDCESWIGTGRHGSTAVMTEWQEFVKNQVRLQGAEMIGPKLICINVQPYGTTQAPERSDILNVGGFSDAVFGVVSAFLGDDAGRFVAEVEEVEL